jgi:hypothetical protein
MKVTIKTLKNEQFNIELEPTDTVNFVVNNLDSDFKIKNIRNQKYRSSIIKISP